MFYLVNILNFHKSRTKMSRICFLLAFAVLSAVVRENSGLVKGRRFNLDYSNYQPPPPPPKAIERNSNWNFKMSWEAVLLLDHNLGVKRLMGGARWASTANFAPPPPSYGVNSYQYNVRIFKSMLLIPQPKKLSFQMDGGNWGYDDYY